MHPATRQRFLEAPRPRPLPRLYYTAADGWRAPLLHLTAAAGGAGEPVVLAHALGLSSEAFRYGRGPTLATRLAAAGFSVYLLAHRGDGSALPPEGAAGFDFDDVLERDLPAALERVRAHAGYPAVHWVGHGLGGQLGLAHAARMPDSLATVTAIAAAVRFDAPASGQRRAALARALLPSWWHLPARAAARAVLPWVEGEGGARLRGVLRYAAEDVPLGLLRQAARWLEAGALVDRTGLLDYRLALADARAPLHVVTAAGDPVCPPAHAAAALGRWGGSDRSHTALGEGWGHLDLLVSPAADTAVFQPVVTWLETRRRAAWGKIRRRPVLGSPVR